LDKPIHITITTDFNVSCPTLRWKHVVCLSTLRMWRYRWRMCTSRPMENRILKHRSCGDRNL